MAVNLQRRAFLSGIVGWPSSSLAEDRWALADTYYFLVSPITPSTWRTYIIAAENRLYSGIIAENRLMAVEGDSK